MATYRSQAGQAGISTKQVEKEQLVEAPPKQDEQVSASLEASRAKDNPEADTTDTLQEWRDRALRLQAEMDNYRRRQRRLAQDQIGSEHKRLLRAFLEIVDDLERALAAPVESGQGLRQGVELTHRAARKLIENEGVEQVQAENQPFDPNWHEAVATVSRNGTSVAANTVVQVMESGYRLGDQLLRPAKVIVAV
jgi:molecular chaperone GrpE